MTVMQTQTLFVDTTIKIMTSRYYADKGLYEINVEGIYYYINLKSKSLLRTNLKYENNNYEEFVYNELIDENDANPLTEYRYNPRSISLLLTSNCNLDCIYCYAKSQADENTSLSEKDAILAVKYALDNYFTGKNIIYLNFHGLGEPTLNMKAIRGTLDYIKQVRSNENVEYNCHLTTNGVMNDTNRHWISANIDSITVSIDGRREVQNYLRKCENADSYLECMKTVKFFINEGKKISIRTTVSNMNVEELTPWVKELYQLGIKQVYVEPVSICGEAVKNEILDVDENLFYENFICARKYGNTHGMEVVFSGMKQNTYRRYHCGAYGYNFVVMPDGALSTCYEYVGNTHSDSGFVFGKICDGLISINHDKLHEIRELALKSISECKDCIALPFCGGGCLCRRYSNESKSRKSYNKKCALLRKLAYYYIWELVEKSSDIQLNNTIKF